MSIGDEIGTQDTNTAEESFGTIELGTSFIAVSEAHVCNRTEENTALLLEHVTKEWDLIGDANCIYHTKDWRYFLRGRPRESIWTQHSAIGVMVHYFVGPQAV